MPSRAPPPKAPCAALRLPLPGGTKLGPLWQLRFKNMRRSTSTFTVHLACAAPRLPYDMRRSTSKL